MLAVVRPSCLVRICDECNYGSYQGRCVGCGGKGISVSFRSSCDNLPQCTFLQDAYYCKECAIQEKDRDGCPKIVNLGSARTDLFYERKKYGFKPVRFPCDVMLNSCFPGFFRRDDIRRAQS